MALAELAVITVFAPPAVVELLERGIAVRIAAFAAALALASAVAWSLAALLAACADALPACAIASALALAFAAGVFLVRGVWSLSSRVRSTAGGGAFAFAFGGGGRRGGIAIEDDDAAAAALGGTGASPLSRPVIIPPLKFAINRLILSFISATWACLIASVPSVFLSRASDAATDASLASSLAVCLAM